MTRSFKNDWNLLCLSFYVHDHTTSMTTTPPNAQPSHPIPPDPTCTSPTSYPFIPIRREKRVVHRNLVPCGECLWLGFRCFLCAVVVSVLGGARDSSRLLNLRLDGRHAGSVEVLGLSLHLVGGSVTRFVLRRSFILQRKSVLQQPLGLQALS